MENQLRPAGARKSRRRLLYIIAIAVGLLILVVAAILIWKTSTQPASPIPAKTLEATSFPAYYPESLPKDFSYEVGSADYSQGTLIYTLTGTGKEITVTQQEAPKEQIQYQKIPGFRSVGDAPGEAVVGTLNGKPVVLLQTETTLITVTGTPAVSQATLIAVAKQMASLSE